MADSAVLTVGAFALTLIVLLFLLASFRVVHEGEFLAIFRLGRAWRAIRPGLAVVIPFIDQTVRVSVPVGMVDIRVARDLHRGATGPASPEVPGQPGLTIAEVCLRAAMLAHQRDPRARRASTDQFQEALRGLTEKERRTAW